MRRCTAMRRWPAEAAAWAAASHCLWLKRDASGSRADLSEASMTAGVKIVSVSGIGSSRRLTNYRVDTDEVWCGGFKGTLAEFTAKVKETHKNNQQPLADYDDYRIFIPAIRAWCALNKE